MRILWITNILLPEASQLLTGEGVLKGSGGWLTESASYLNRVPNTCLFVCSITPMVRKLTVLLGKDITYYLIPKRKKGNSYDRGLEDSFISITNQIQPDIVHIHGTEFPYGLAYVKACGSKNVVVSLQGMPSEIIKYYDGGIKTWEKFRRISIRDIYMGNSFFASARKMKLCANYEIDLLKNVCHVIGRTNWDRVHSLMINSNLKYHSCNESLRETFYGLDTWQYDKCTPHSIFVSQMHAPLKGFHILLQALPFVIKQYPDVSVRVAGWDIIRGNSFFERIKMSGYAKILKSIIKKERLESRIIRVGQLDAEGMKQELLHSNVYICPSSIENSPNSLGEAQMLGVPSIASFVGGVPDFIQNRKCGYLYRYDDFGMLADLICNVFSQSDFDNTEMKRIANSRHDRTANTEQLINIYKSVNNSCR